ncbi:MAG TPA: hypothetical protein VK403_11635 [Allosphingosinicella sp.]|nr:hypothetical protein [Allosphingosinicella sp.]
MLVCSTDRPWAIHPALRSDEDCPRCGWTAPGPAGDARAAEAMTRAGELGWTVFAGGPTLDPGQGNRSLAA